MRSLIILPLGLVCMGVVKVQDYDFNNSHYGVNIYQSSTGSGYGSSMNMNINVNAQKYNRVPEVGLMLNATSQKIKGFEFTYKHFPGFHSANFYKRAFKPYFHYNFLYRTPATVIVGPSSINSPKSDYSYFRWENDYFRAFNWVWLTTKTFEAILC